MSLFESYTWTISDTCHTTCRSIFLSLSQSQLELVEDREREREKKRERERIYRIADLLIFFFIRIFCFRNQPIPTHTLSPSHSLPSRLPILFQLSRSRSYTLSHSHTHCWEHLARCTRSRRMVYSNAKHLHLDIFKEAPPPRKLLFKIFFPKTQPK